MLPSIFPSILYSRFHIQHSGMQLYNTLTKQKEAFEPPKDGVVKMYTCGPTVYDYVHIGNLRAYVMADTLRRTLAASGLEVQHVKNITDVGHLTADDLGQGDSGEDKLMKKAQSEGKSPEEIARFYTDYYHTTEAALNILAATIEPRATEYVPQMIQFIEILIEKDYAYSVNGNVFFDVTRFKEYGTLSGNSLEKLKVGARLEEHPDKRNPWDFALWLKAPEGHLMHWESPWGVGYPGWHIECSAMNLATLGPTIDIHTGGEDNIFPHHEAEIAQSECGNDVPFVRYWVHTRHLLVDGQKMSKSKGNFYKLEDIIERGYSAMDLRLLYLSAHYRSQMNFTWEALAQAKANRETLMQAHGRMQNLSRDINLSTNGDTYWTEFSTAIDDDINTPLALSWALNAAKWVNTMADKGQPIHPDDQKQYEKILFGYFGLSSEVTVVPSEISILLDERKAARESRDFALSDALRERISELSWIVEDGPNGQTVRKK